MSETVKFKFKLGIRARDRVTDLVGILDMRAEYLNGCIRYSLQPSVGSDSTKRPDGYWVDEQQLEKVDDGLNKSLPVRKSLTGGPVEKSNNARM